MLKHTVIISPQYLPHVGGVERYTHNLALQLVKLGHAVTVITSLTDDLPERETLDGIEIFRIPSLGLLEGRFPVVKPFKKASKSIRHILEEKNPDLVIIQTRLYPLSLLGARAAHALGLPSLVIEHGTAHIHINNALVSRLEQVYEHWLAGRVNRVCRHFYGVSHACNDWLKHFGIQAEGVLYNAVNVDEIHRIAQSPAVDFRQELQLPPDAFVVTYTGRLIGGKGIFKLIEAVNRLSEQHSQLHLIIVGDGELRKDVEREIGEHVHYLGQIEFKQVVALLKQSDVFCLPTDTEGFSTSVLEAAACGCFIVTTPTGGSPELLCSDEYGILLKENSVDEIVQCIERVMADPDYKERAVAMAHQRLLECFTWEKAGQAVDELRLI